jgi:hypothetical protein
MADFSEGRLGSGPAGIHPSATFKLSYAERLESTLGT